MTELKPQSIFASAAMKGTKIAELRGHTDKVKSVMFSPDEDSVITSSDDGTVRVWSSVDVLKVC